MEGNCYPSMTLSWNKMAKIGSYILCWLATLAGTLMAETKVTTTSPVNPVKKDGILSLHCQVFNIQEGQEVSIFYQDKNARKRLSLNDKVVDPDEEQRIFLAVRRLDGGSFVYFLSILTATIADAGKYSCTIMDTTNVMPTLISSDSVDINVQYFPADYPICNPDKQIRVHAGRTVSLNCSSEMGYPHVSLTWTKEGETLQSTSHNSENRVDSILYFVPKLEHNGAIFVCTAQSEAFPDRTRTCHVGPITVYGVNTGVINTPLLPIDTNKHKTDVINTDIRLDEPDWTSVAEKCADSCPLLKSSVFYWIVSTTIACVFAFVFLFVGIVLLIKYNRMSGNISRETYLARKPVSEDVYEKMEYIVNDRKMYMTLAKHEQELQAIHAGTLVSQRDNCGTVVIQ